MDQDLINKVITVSGKEEKMQGGKPVMKIKDQDNLTYTVYKTKQDGSESVAWSQIPSIDETVQIGFVEQKGEYEGKPVTYRTIRVFNKDIGNGVANLTPRQERFVEGASVNMKLSNPLYDKPKEEPKDDKFWEQQAYEKCCSLWIAAEIQAGNRENIHNLLESGVFWETFKAIKADGKKRFFEFDKPQGVQGASVDTSQQFTSTQELPTIQVQENISEEWDKTFNCTVCGTQGATHGDGHDCIPF